ncbi:transposable element Tcb1 transposase [Trichonephila clavipes]|nr:transposable element Tcb1 transposase [Trichonephila clavipes]
MSRRKQRSAFDQVSEFDRGRIVAYRDCGLPFKEIGSRVGRNQTTCTTSREDRQIGRMVVKNRSVTSRNVAQHIEPVTHHSVSALTIRRRLQQSGLSTRRPLLGLPLTQNHRRLRRQWCDERRTWAAEWIEVVFTDESRICLQHRYGRIRVWRHRGERMLNSCVMHRHTGPAPGIMGLATAIFQQDNARPHVVRIVQRFFVNYQIELLPWPARFPDLSPIENMRSMVAQRLTKITPPAATPDQLWQRVEAAWSAVPQEHIQSLFESMPRRVAACSPLSSSYFITLAVLWDQQFVDCCTTVQPIVVESYFITLAVLWDQQFVDCCTTVQPIAVELFYHISRAVGSFVDCCTCSPLPSSYFITLAVLWDQQFVDCCTTVQPIAVELFYHISRAVGSTVCGLLYYSAAHCRRVILSH